MWKVRRAMLIFSPLINKFLSEIINQDICSWQK
jgi:hypothetical protein